MTTCKQCHWEHKGRCRVTPQVQGNYPLIDLTLPSCGKFRHKKQLYKKPETVVDITKSIGE